MGKKRAAPHESREVILKTSVSEYERDLIKQRADARGMTVSGYLRWTALSAENMTAVRGLLTDSECRALAQLLAEARRQHGEDTIGILMKTGAFHELGDGEDVRVDDHNTAAFARKLDGLPAPARQPAQLKGR